MLYNTCVPRSILHSPYLQSTSNSLAQANTATAIPTAIIARCTLRVDHCILPIVHCLLPSARCPSLTARPLLPIAWPGGMCGAIESAALAVRQELACRIHSRSPHPQLTKSSQHGLNLVVLDSTSPILLHSQGAHCSMFTAHGPMPIAHCPLPSAWAGGVHGAIG